MHDLFSDTYGVANDWARESYLGLINQWPRAWAAVYRRLDRQEKFAGNFRIFFTLKKRFRELLARFEPDVILSVYPAYPHMLDEILGEDGATRARRVVVITDSLSVNAIWYRCRSDYFLLPNEPSAAVLHRAGIPPEKTRTFGFPVSPEFAEGENIRQPPSAQHGRRVLYLVNAQRAHAPELVVRLAGVRGIQLTVAFGRDRRMQKAIEQVRSVSAHPFRLVGWTEELPRLLRSSHLLISKAGGASLQEALAAGCPLIVNHIIPGQEEGNARYLLAADCGAIALDDEEIIAAIEATFARDAAQWHHWSRNIAPLARPRAALETAEFLLTL